eukprot:contig_13305_g3173
MIFLGRQQCRASAYAVTEVPETGTCAKNYQATRKSFTPGAFLNCCACAQPRVLGFIILDKREGPPALLSTTISRFAILPEYVVHEFGCGAVRSALTKLPWLLCDSTISSDELHVVNHVCSVSFDPRSFLTLNKANTVAHEQRNRAIKSLSRVLRACGQAEYTRLLAYHTFIQNVRAHARSASPDPLPDLYEFGRSYSTRGACLCGCGHVVPDPFAAADFSDSSVAGTDGFYGVDGSAASGSSDDESSTAGTADASEMSA